MIDVPALESTADFARWRSDPTRWSPVVDGIARRAGLTPRRPSASTTGTNLVVDLDGRSILKLFPAIYRSQFGSERATLRHLAGTSSVPIPSILAEGEEDGWSWLILTKLDGIVGSQVWPTLFGGDKEPF